MRYLTQRLAHLWSAAYNLTPLERRASVRFACGVGVAALAVILLLALRVAGTQVGVEHPLWEAVLQARAVLVRLILAVPVLIFALLGAEASHQTLENTELGRRTMTWDSSDNERVMAEKTRNAGSLHAALVLAWILGLCWGVLR